MKQIGEVVAGSRPLQNVSAERTENRALQIRRSSRTMPAIIDRLADIEIPNRAWDPWIEPGKPRCLRRQLTEAERAALEHRRQELAPWVCGLHEAERSSAAEAVLDMLTNFTSLTSLSEEAAAAKVESMLRGLSAFPLWAIQKTCDRIKLRGFVREEKGRYVTERHWPPTLSELIAAIEDNMKLYRDQHDSAVRLLEAKVVQL